MSGVRATIDKEIRIALAHLPAGAAEAIKANLTIVDPEAQKAVARGDWGAGETSPYVDLWDQRGPDLVMPRGYAQTLVDGMRISGREVTWDDQTTSRPFPMHDLLRMRTPVLRPEQEVACQKVMHHRQGVLQAGVGAGKTVIGLEAWRRIGERGLVLVEKRQLMDQWRDRALEHIGVEVGMIGDGRWDERPLTIATLQTLRARLPELRRDGWFARWGITFADEAHHIGSAVSYLQIVREVVSRYLIGLTATPLDGEWIQSFLEAVIGPVFHRAGDGDTLKPEVRLVPTGFRWKPANAREEKLKDTRTIWRHVLAALVQNDARLSLVARGVLAQPESCAQLVLAKQLGYLGALRQRLVDLGYPSDRILQLRGRETDVEREAVISRAAEGSCVIMSTIAYEGTDVPRLDRLHLPWPQRKERVVIQQVGRVVRRHPEKLAPVVIDYVDEDPMLYDQSRSRRRAYASRGWTIITPRGDRL